MLDFMWLLMERGVDAESTTLPAKMSVDVPPPKFQVTMNIFRSHWFDNATYLGVSKLCGNKRNERDLLNNSLKESTAQETELSK